MVTLKATDYLARRGLLSPVLLQGLDYLYYGNDFADHPDSDRRGVRRARG